VSEEGVGSWKSKVGIGAALPKSVKRKRTRCHAESAPADEASAIFAECELMQIPRFARNDRFHLARQRGAGEKEAGWARGAAPFFLRFWILILPFAFGFFF
jgi:hypothetical protein